jgi:hypothetical protein
MDWAKICENALKAAAFAFCASIAGSVAKEVLPLSPTTPQQFLNSIPTKK